MPTYTTPYNLAKPGVSDAADGDQWGYMLNDNMDIINDALVEGNYSLVIAKTANYTVTLDDLNALITGDVTAGGFTITLPTAADAGDGFKVTVKKIDSASNTLSIDAAGSETIDGSLTYDITAQYQAVTLCSNGTSWYVFGTAAGITGGAGTIPIEQGGTGATTAAGARSNLGLGTMATQNASAIAVTGGTMSGVAISGGSITGVAGIPSVTNSANGKIVIGAVTIQWGSSTVTGSTTSEAITYGTAFSGTPYSVIPTFSKSGLSASTGVTSVTSSNFMFTLGSSQSNFVIYWVAIGPT